MQVEAEERVYYICNEVLRHRLLGLCSGNPKCLKTPCLVLSRHPLPHTCGTIDKPRAHQNCSQINSWAKSVSKMARCVQGNPNVL